MDLPCLCSIDRAGIVGEDGPTHHGVFDVSILSPIPNIVLFAPKDARELRQFVNTAFHNFNKPYFIRIPRGSYGDNVEKIKTIIKSKHLNIRIINARFIKPIDEDMVHKIFTENNKPILVYETILKTGSLGSILLTYCNEKHILRTFEHIALADHYSKQGSVQEIYDDEKIDLDTVINKCEELMNGKKEN